MFRTFFLRHIVLIIIAFVLSLFFSTEVVAGNIYCNVSDNSYSGATDSNVDNSYGFVLSDDVDEVGFNGTSSANNPTYSVKNNESSSECHNLETLYLGKDSALNAINKDLRIRLKGGMNSFHSTDPYLVVNKITTGGNGVYKNDFSGGIRLQINSGSSTSSQGVQVNSFDFSKTDELTGNSVIFVEFEGCNNNVGGNMDFSAITTGRVRIDFSGGLRSYTNIHGKYTGGNGNDELIYGRTANLSESGLGTFKSDVNLNGGANYISIDEGYSGSSKVAYFDGDLSATGGTVNIKGEGGIRIGTLGKYGGDFNFYNSGYLYIGTAEINGNTLYFNRSSTNVTQISSFNVSVAGGTLQGYGSSDINIYNRAQIKGDFDISGNATKSFVNGVDIASGKTLTTSGSGVVTLNTVAGGGNVNFGGTGSKHLKGTGINELEISGTGTVYAVGALSVNTLAITTDADLSTNGTNSIQANNTSIISGKTLTARGNGAIDLGSVTGDGSINFGGTGNKSLSAAGLSVLQVSGACTVNATGELTVDTLDIDATTILNSNGNNVTVNTGTEVAGGILTVAGNGSGTVKLGALTTGAGGGLTIDSTAGNVIVGAVALGGGNFSITNNKAGDILLSNISTTTDNGELEVKGSSGGKVNAGNLNVSNDITVTAGIEFAATNTSIASGKTLSTSGDSDVSLGVISGGGSVNFGGEGNKSLASLDLAKLQVSEACTVNATGVLTVDTMDIDAATILNATGNNVTVSTGTEVTGGTLTVAGGGNVNLGALTTGAGGGLTIDSSAGDVTVGSVELGSGMFSLTNNKAGDVLFSIITTAADNGELEVKGSSGGKVNAGNLLVSNDITLNAAIEFDATNTSIVSGKTLSTSRNSVVTLGAVTGTGSINFGGTGKKSLSGTSLNTLQVSDSCTIDAAGALTVDTLDIDADTNLISDGINDLIVSLSTNIANGSTLKMSGDSLVKLSGLTGSGTVDFYGAGDKYISGTGATNIAVSEACTIYTTGNLTAGTLDIDADTELVYSLNQLSLSSLDIASDKRFKMSGAGDSSITGMTTLADGAGIELVESGVRSFSNITFAGNNTIAVGTGVTASFTSSVDLTSAGANKLILDFGTDEGIDGKAASGTYAKINGISNLTVSKSDNTIEQLFGTNGIAGLTYEGVLDQDNTEILAGDILSTDDNVRIYKVASNRRDIVVTVAGDNEYKIIRKGRGSHTAATAGQDLVDKQKDFDEPGHKYVTEFAKLVGPAAARAAAQVIGEEETIQTAQTALTTITAASGSVENQMVKFRSGNIAKGLASSFGGGGLTSAMNNVADSEELAQAYEEGLSSDGENTTIYNKVTVWANGFCGFGEQGTVDKMMGYSFWNTGTIVGFDYAFDREFRVGALVGYSYNSTNVNQHSGNSIDNALRLGAYFSYAWDNFFTDFSTTMGVHLIKSTRYIWDGTTAIGERTGLDVSVNEKLGYTFTLPYEVNITPSYSLGYTFFHDPEFTESETGVTNVKYSSFNSNSLVQDIGINFGKLFRVSDGLAFLPEVWGGWEYEYLDTGGTRNTTT